MALRNIIKQEFAKFDVLTLGTSMITTTPGLVGPSKFIGSKILDETNLKISIEASHPMSWKKYVGNNGVTMGIEDFGRSAPYKDIYKYFKLTDDDIVNKALKLRR